MELAARVIRGWGVILGVPALFVVAYVYPHIPIMNRIEVCAVRGFLGFDCPGCGLASSMWAIAHGHIRRSIDLHPLGIVVAGWLVYFFLRTLVGSVRERPLPELLSQGSRDVLIYAFLAALIVQWLFKLWIG